MSGTRAVLILFVCFLTGNATPVVVAHVQDGETKQALAGAMVRREGSDIMAVTDSTGRCMVVSVPKKGGMLLASRTGYFDLKLPWSPPARPVPDTVVVDLPLYSKGPRVVVGLVSDAGTKFAIAGALVSIAGTSLAESTRADGGFSFGSFPPGLQRVEVSYLGLPKQSLSVVAKAGETTAVEIYLLDTTNVGSVEGTVFDAGTGKPVTGATVAVNGTGREAVTDSTGRYAIANVPVGLNKLLVSCEGYLKAYTMVRLVKNWAVTADLYLRESPSQSVHGE